MSLFTKFFQSLPLAAVIQDKGYFVLIRNKT